jgi:peptidoglycan/LPS O-acetylase OafA/YrhL
MPSSTRVFFRQLEALRGIAALIVVIYHVGWINPLYDIGIIRNGALMVDVFFVLSGFVMMHCYGEYFVNKAKVIIFMKSRFWRLYPLHLLMLCVFLLIEIAKYIAELKFDVQSGAPAFSKSNGESFFYQVFLLHSLFQDHGSFNSPSWSISTEFYTYILFAFLMTFTHNVKQRYIIFICISAISLFTILSLGHKSLTFDYQDSIFRCFYGFFIGAFTYEIYKIMLKRVQELQYKKIKFIFLTITLIILVYILAIKHDNYLEFVVPPLVGLFILLIILSPNNIINKILCLPLFLWLGKISYSIYMIHLAFIWFFSALMQVLMKAPKIEAENGDLVISIPQFQGGIMVIVLLSSILFFSHFTYKYIEVKFR